jgi:hypothetical protein
MNSENDFKNIQNDIDKLASKKQNCVTIAKVKRPRPEIIYLITSTNQQRQFKILQIIKKNKIN